MWVKKSPEELRKPSPIKRRLLGALALGSFVFIGSTTFGGIYYYGATGHLFCSFQEMASRTPLGLLFSIVLGSWFYWFSGRKSPSPKGDALICPKCEKTKFDDGTMYCPCGGHFEDIQTMKWVNPSEPSQE